jgi:hypothetical protein
MSDEPNNVVYLVSETAHPKPRSCTHCVHYHPDERFHKKTVTWQPEWPFRRVERVPGALSHFNSFCSFFGGHHASDARAVCEGDHWEGDDG